MLESMDFKSPQESAPKETTRIESAQAAPKPPARMMRQYELVERVRAYDPDVNEDLLNRAYVFAMQAHGTQMRASGDPYFSHPLEVAGILADMKMDAKTIATALLHDTVEDTPVTLQDVEKLFGADVARLVDGVSKLSRIAFQDDQVKQAENFRKLVLAMSADIRVLLVKLADRLHNMRTLHFLQKPEKRRRIARETLEIYVPLAERIGIKTMQDELQDLAFGELYPEARESIVTRLSYLRAAGVDMAKHIQTILTQLLASEGVQAAVEGREKTPYSIWRKMQRKNIAFEQLSDIMAFRVQVDTVLQCYQVLGILHSHYPVVPGRFKDYISTPKPNQYQSLHTGIIGPDGHRIEVQIRTRDMHEIAQMGVAAHWAYKQGSPDTDGHQYRWLRELLDIVEHAQKPEEFLEHTRLELFQDQVFCFTPKGDIIALPRSATPVDFAYAVHSKVGDACVGAKVNGRMVPLRTALRNGDQVEIITQKDGKPSPMWERFVVTGKARAHIRRYIRIQQRSEYIVLGRALLEKICKQEGVDYAEKPFEAVMQTYQASNLDDLLAAIGSSLQPAREVFYAAFPQYRPKPAEKSIPVLEAGMPTPERSREKTNAGPLQIEGLIPGMAVHFARCCHPLPGDSIVGIVSTGRGVTIHTQDCKTLLAFRDSPERWVDVDWGKGSGRENVLVGRLTVVLTNRPNSLGALTTIIGKGQGNILNLKIVGRTLDFFDILVDVEVKDINHLNTLIAALRANPAISSVERTVGR